jgi:hypothetical protein
MYKKGLTHLLPPQVEKIPETASDISPYATSALQPTPGKGNTATLGRKETLRLTDYHRQGDTLRIRQQVRPEQLYIVDIFFFKNSRFEETLTNLWLYDTWKSFVWRNTGAVCTVFIEKCKCDSF